jgi:hypothetical protein
VQEGRDLDCTEDNDSADIATLEGKPEDLKEKKRYLIYDSRN